MSKRDSKKKDKKMPEITEEVKDVETAEGPGETIEEEGTETVIEPEAPVVPETPKEPESPVTVATTVSYENLSAEEAGLKKLLDEYICHMYDMKGGIAKNELHLTMLAKIIRYVVKYDKENLFAMLYNTLFISEAQHVIHEKVIFQKLEEIRDPNINKAKILYSTMASMRKFQNKPKTSGFPIDLKVVKEKFGGMSFVPFIKRTLGM